MKKIAVIILAVVMLASCNMIGLMFEDDRDLFVGRWEDYGGYNTFTFEENGGCEITSAPIGLNWSIDSDDQVLKIWSILWIFSIEADYEFVSDDEIIYTITDLSTLARSYYDKYDSYHLYKISSSY